MSVFVFILIATFVLMILAIGCLTIGRLITGKQKLHRGCGYNPHKKKDQKDSECGERRSCEICNEKKHD